MSFCIDGKTFGQPVIGIVRAASIMPAALCYWGRRAEEHKGIRGDGKILNPSVSAEKGRFVPGECFDKVWQIINEEFRDPYFNGADWKDARK
ncbi:MAG: hypothetical protein ACYS8I_02445 [Planctomycetota bacterium]